MASQDLGGQGLLPGVASGVHARAQDGFPRLSRMALERPAAVEQRLEPGMVPLGEPPGPDLAVDHLGRDQPLSDHGAFRAVWRLWTVHSSGVCRTTSS